MIRNIVYYGICITTGYVVTFVTGWDFTSWQWWAICVPSMFTVAIAEAIIWSEDE